MSKTVTLMSFILTLAITAMADVPRPDRTPAGKKAKAVDTYLSIQLDRDAGEARLIIPRDQLKTLRAEIEDLENSTDDRTANDTGSFTRVQTIVSGIFLSLAIVFGGIWFTRTGGLTSASGRFAGAAMVVFSAGALATMVYGNAGPPAEAREITGRMFSPALHVYKFGSGKIKLEVSDTERNPKLIVPDKGPKPSE